jgi:hypothetical protein
MASPPCIVPGFRGSIGSSGSTSKSASFNVGHGDMQIRSDEHTVQNTLKEQFEVQNAVFLRA